MHLSIRSQSYEPAPIVMTRILNKRECGVAYVSTIFGKLCYREAGHGFSRTDGISHVFMLASQVLRDVKPPNNLLVDFDVYLQDGRVVEVQTCHRATIEAALMYAPKKDVRAKFRAARGCR